MDQFQYSAHALGQEPMIRHRIRRTVTDYGSTMVQWSRNRRRGISGRFEQERPSLSYIVDMTPPFCHRASPAEVVPSKHLHTSIAKNRQSINVVRWTPEGRRLLTCAFSGEFTMWNGMAFNFETIATAHDCPVRAAEFTHNGEWLLSGDQRGLIKYWTTSLGPMKSFAGHDAVVRDIAIAPTDAKFVTAAEDATLKLWDFGSTTSDLTFTGHGWDVRCVDWHPSKGLIASGSKDKHVNLWDPRNGKCLTTLYGHKSPISKVAFEPSNGLCLATSASESVARVFDLRMMRDVLLLRGHEGSITTIRWHPFCPSLVSTGGHDGSIMHYILDEPNAESEAQYMRSPYDDPDPANAEAQSIYPAHRIPFAHDSAVWSLDWSPFGHILASGSNDRLTRFWTRARPGEETPFKDKYHTDMRQGAVVGQAGHVRSFQQGNAHDDVDRDDEEPDDEEDALAEQTMPTSRPILPGLQNLGRSQPQDDLPGYPNAAILQEALRAGDAPPSNNGGELPPGISPRSTNGVSSLGLPELQPGAPTANTNFQDPRGSASAHLYQNGGNPGALRWSSMNQTPPTDPSLLAPGSMPFQSGQPFFPMKTDSIDNMFQAYSQNPYPSAARPFPPNVGGGANADTTFQGIRRRTPLPSQADSLRQEQSKGQYRRAR